MNIHDLTPIVYWLLLFIVSGIGIFRYKSLTLPFKILTWAALGAFLLSILSKIWIINYGTNAPITHIEAITEYVFYSLVYYYLFKNEKIKKVILVFIVIFVIFFFINALVLEPYQHVFPNNIRIPAQLLYVVFAFLLAKQMMSPPSDISPLRQSVFWYVFGLVFYSITLVFTIAYSNYSSAHASIFDPYIYYLWYFILYLFHTFIGVALLIDNKKNILADDYD